MSSTRSVAMDPRISARRQAVEQDALRTRGRQWLVALTILLVFCGAVAALQSNLLDVDRIVVHGAVATSPEMVASVSEVAIAEPLYNVDLDRAVAAVVALPLVDTVEATRHWSGSVSIRITERVPTAQVSTTNGAVIVDHEGRVLAVEPIGRAELPTIEGFTLSTSPGRWVSDDVVRLAAIGAALPEDIAQATDAIVLGESGVELRVARSGTATATVALPATDDAAANETSIDDFDEIEGVEGDEATRFSRVLLGDDRELSEKFWSIRAFLFGVDVACFATLDVRAPSVPVLTRHDTCPIV